MALGPLDLKPKSMVMLPLLSSASSMVLKAPLSPLLLIGSPLSTSVSSALLMPLAEGVALSMPSSLPTMLSSMLLSDEVDGKMETVFTKALPVANSEAGTRT